MATRDRDKWNATYRRRGAPVEPSSFLPACADLLPATGNALDVAAGAGRHGLWLAERELDVTLVDIADEGLSIARRRAAALGRPVTTLVRDLDEGLPPGPWDVVASFYFMDRALFSQFASALAPGGLLLFAQPTVVNLERHDKPPRAFLLETGELPDLVQGLEIVRFFEGWTEDGRHEARLAARRL